MRNFKNRAWAAALLLCGVAANAQQKLSINNVYKVTLQNSGTINEDEQIKGYYFFYQSDKIDRKTNEYTLQIVDENLNKLKDIKFTDSKDIVLMESSFNGSAMVFTFYNTDTRTLEYRVFGLDGKQKFVYTKELDKATARWMGQQMAKEGDEGENKNVFNVNGRGFIAITPVKEDKNYTYEINFYGSDKRKIWNFNPVETGKFTEAQFLGTNDSIAIVEVLSKNSRTSKEMESTLVGVNLETGRKAFEVRTQDGGKGLYPMNISTLNGSNAEFLLIGPYYAAGEKVGDKTDGLGVWLMNNQGKLLKSKYVSWTKDMAKYLNVDKNGKVEDMGFVYIHKLLQTEDGKIFAIGEGYKKAADGVGIAMTLLAAAGGGGYYGGVTKLVITNMLLLELTPTFELKSAKVYEKNKNDFGINANTDFVSPHTLASLAKWSGGFDYNFTQTDKSHATFMSAYTDYVRGKDYKGLTFNAISYYDGKISTDKINLNTKATSMAVLPAKPGSVMLIEYFKKDKKLDLRLEKIN